MSAHSALSAGEKIGAELGKNSLRTPRNFPDSPGIFHRRDFFLSLRHFPFVDARRGGHALWHLSQHPGQVINCVPKQFVRCSLAPNLAFTVPSQLDTSRLIVFSDTTQSQREKPNDPKLFHARAMRSLPRKTFAKLGSALQARTSSRPAKIG